MDEAWMAKAPTQAVILAGGLGTRLGEVTKVTPKPLVSVLDVPFLHHLIGNVVRHGFTDIVLLCGYMAEKFDVLTEPGVFGEATVRLSIEPPGLLGTGGAVRHAAPLLDERFLLMNGDTFFDINLLDLCTEPDDGAWMRMALRREPAAGRYGSVALEDGRVTGFDASAQDGDGLINGGVYCMDRRVLGEIGPGACSIERDVFPVLARAGRVEGRVYEGRFLDIGVPLDLARADGFVEAVRTRPAAFFDRDGVLNIDHGYVHSADRLDWVDGAREAVKALNDAGYYVFVVTNQAGVARGYYGREQVEAFHRHLNEDLRNIGAHIDAFEYCPFHPEGIVEEFSFSSRRRKPEPGMLLDLIECWPVKKSGSFLIGDRETDLEAARAAGVKDFLFPGGDLFAFCKNLRLV